jgi:hypothetical protein
MHSECSNPKLREKVIAEARLSLFICQTPTHPSRPIPKIEKQSK